MPPISSTESPPYVSPPAHARTAELLETTLRDPARLAALRSTGLLDTEVEEVFDRLSRLAVRLLRVPAAFISLVDENRDFYKSACGVGATLASVREISGPTFCHYTAQQTTPLVIPDTAADPLYRDVPTVKTLGVAAYVGIPLVFRGEVIGSFCAIDAVPHAWTMDEVETLTEIAASAQREMELRGALADARSANRAKSEFLSMMSHELRTPLNAIGGYSELIRMGMQGPVTPEQLEFLNRIQRASKHLQTLISDILDFARLDAGRVQFAMRPVDVGHVVSEAAELLAPQMAEARLEFSRAACGTEPVVNADWDKLRQILLNLLANAIKFTPATGRVSVRCAREGDVVRIDVTDTGRGIARKDLSSIFEPFVQVDRASTPARHQGVGLGLAICRAFARGMGGDLTVKSEPGKGSTFTLTLRAA